MIQISAEGWQVFIAERLSTSQLSASAVIYTLGIFDVKRIVYQIGLLFTQVALPEQGANLAPGYAAIYNKLVRGPVALHLKIPRKACGVQVSSLPRPVDE